MLPTSGEKVHLATTRPASWILLAAAALAVAGCGAHASPASVTTAEVRIDCGAPDVTGPISSQLTVSGSGFDPFSFPLSCTGGSQGAWIAGIPAGPSRTFRIDMFDAGGTLTHTGSLTADVPPGGRLVLVAVVEPVAAPPPPMVVSAPVIELAWLSRDSVSGGGQITVGVTASDPQGGAVTISWSATCGTFDTPSAASAVWTAPAGPASCVLEVTVSGAGSSVSLSMGTIVVLP
jgi:hypothetical protein